MDAGPLYAYVDRDDAHHRECLELLQSHPGPLLVPTLVVTEVTYLLGTPRWSPPPNGCTIGRSRHWTVGTSAWSGLGWER